MRPLDRDALVEKWSSFLKANVPETPAHPIILVTTQCLEVGADFSFDALVTECASLDALRQRFGRLNRLRAHDSAPAAIFARAEDVKSDAMDPIYGTALALTWAWLNRVATRIKVQPAFVDFGIASLDCLLAEKTLDQPNGSKVGLIAPTEDAPVLLPAHLDMLCQTSPRPDPEPEVSLFLHGKRPAQPHAFVVWRSDFGEETKNWQKTVALLPPSPGEMLQAPLFRIRRWLAEQAPERAEPDGDVESSAATADENVTLSAAKSMFLLWRGRRKQSLLCTDPASIRYGDVVVVPAALSPDGLGQQVPPDDKTTGGVGEHRADLAERAWHTRHLRAVLRVTPQVLAPWQSWQPIADLLVIANDITATRQEIHAALDDLRTQMGDSACPLPEWLKQIVTDLKAPRSERHPVNGLILFGPKTNCITEETFFGDEDDEFADTENGISLNAHTADVLHYGREFASRCLPEPLREPVLTALRLHDIGKLDPRVQLMLHGGDEIARDSAPEPLAKSASNSAKKSREECGLPGDFRHEMLSLQIAEHCGWLPVDEASAALTAHLISSHHGYARPWAPIAPDPAPPIISLNEGFVISQRERLAWTPVHHIASGIGDRFWLLTRRFGWWGLPMLEAVVRLTDWYASRTPRDYSTQQSPLPTATTRCLPTENKHEILLTGLDPSNPVGWLATLGTFRLASHVWPENHLKLGWCQASGGWRPVLFSSRQLSFDDLVSMLDQRVLDLRVMFSARLDRARNEMSPIGKKGERKWQDTLKYPLAAYLQFCHMVTEPRYVQRVRATIRNNHLRPLPRWEFAASWASEMSPKEHKDPAVYLVKKTFFDFTSGQQGFVEKLTTLRSHLSIDDIRSTLLGPWNYRRDAESMRWDPIDEKRQYALQAIDPSDGNKNPAISVIAANALAAEALPLFPAIPTLRGRQAGVPSSEDYYAWCLWENALGLDSVRALVHAAAAGIHADLRGPFGVTQTFRATLAKSGKDYYCFTPSKVT
jgi:CRISPR-associated endonuclease/helicase Cas3